MDIFPSAARCGSFHRPPNLAVSAKYPADVYNAGRMRIGILSDTHDQMDAAAQAVRMLRQAGAQGLIHCGDVGRAAILDELAGGPAVFVWGNTDCDRLALHRHGANLQIECLGEWGEVTWGDKRIAVLHGDDLSLRRRLLEGQEYDYLLQGHTHSKTDQRIGRTRLINPGALHRAAVKTVALLETDNDQLDFLTVMA